MYTEKELGKLNKEPLLIAAVGLLDQVKNLSIEVGKKTEPMTKAAWDRKVLAHKKEIEALKEKHKEEMTEALDTSAIKQKYDDRVNRLKEKHANAIETLKAKTVVKDDSAEVAELKQKLAVAEGNLERGTLPLVEQIERMEELYALRGITLQKAVDLIMADYDGLLATTKKAKVVMEYFLKDLKGQVFIEDKELPEEIQEIKKRKLKRQQK